jgi:hypothetical protein
MNEPKSDPFELVPTDILLDAAFKRFDNYVFCGTQHKDLNNVVVVPKFQGHILLLMGMASKLSHIINHKMNVGEIEKKDV